MSKINKPTAPLVTIDPDTKADLVNGEVPASQLPSYVDDVLEFVNVEAFPATGEEGKIYVALNTNLTYRWSGSAYIQINDVDLSNYYTKSESDTLLGGKEDTISDLEDIRAGAAAGATAVQSSDLDNEISAYVGSHLPGSGLSAGSDSSGYNQLSVDENYLNEYLEFAKPADLEAKQDVINDLDAIRSGAAAGATALQSVPSEYVTETELSNYHDSSKQDAIYVLELNNGEVISMTEAGIVINGTLSNEQVEAIQQNPLNTWAHVVVESLNSSEYFKLTYQVQNSQFANVMTMVDVSNNTNTLVPFIVQVDTNAKTWSYSQQLRPLISQKQIVGMMNDIEVFGNGTHYEAPDGGCRIIEGYDDISVTLKRLDHDFMKQCFSHQQLTIALRDTLGRVYSFQATGENSANVCIINPTFGYQGGSYLSTQFSPIILASVSIETDLETGDPVIVVSNMHTPNTSLSDFLADIKQNGWQAKANASDTYTKSEVDTAIANAIGNTLNEEF